MSITLVVQSLITQIPSVSVRILVNVRQPKMKYAAVTAKRILMTAPCVWRPVRKERTFLWLILDHVASLWLFFFIICIYLFVTTICMPSLL